MIGLHLHQPNLTAFTPTPSQKYELYRRGPQSNNHVSTSYFSPTGDSGVCKLVLDIVVEDTDTLLFLEGGGEVIMALSTGGKRAKENTVL